MSKTLQERIDEQKVRLEECDDRYREARRAGDEEAMKHWERECDLADEKLDELEEEQNREWCGH